MADVTDISPLARVMRHVDEVADGAPSPDTVRTGFPSVDKLLGGGARRGDLVVLVQIVGHQAEGARCRPCRGICAGGERRSRAGFVQPGRVAGGRAAGWTGPGAAAGLYVLRDRGAGERRGADGGASLYQADDQPVRPSSLGTSFAGSLSLPVIKPASAMNFNVGSALSAQWYRGTEKR